MVLACSLGLLPSLEKGQWWKDLFVLDVRHCFLFWIWKKPWDILKNISLYINISVSVALPYLGVAIVSDLYVHLVPTRRQRGETTGDVCWRPARGDALLSAHVHGAAITSASQVRTLDGENAVSYKKGVVKVNTTTQSETIL